MKLLNFTSHPELKNDLPEKAIQFGEGNFLRCFIDWMIHRLNSRALFNGRIIAVQPTPHGKIIASLNEQNGLYTTVLRGMQNGSAINQKEIITSVSRGINPYTDWQDVLKCAQDPNVEFVFSNTTEAGLAYNEKDTPAMLPPASFPAKLTLYLYRRYEYFAGAADKGMYIIPCELLEQNGNLLRSIILRCCRRWKLPPEFEDWIIKHNKFCNTLVDRVVSGYPKDEAEHFAEELGYEDSLLVCGEPFHFFAVEGDAGLAEKLPFSKAGLNAVIESDITKYRQRKVRLLNGGHTASVPAAFLSGFDTVAEMMSDSIAGSFTRRVINQIILPSINMDKALLSDFAASVIERFQNPFIRHCLLSILLNSIAKFKVRVLPSLLEYRSRFGFFPEELLFAFAACICVYKPIRTDRNHLYGLRQGREYELTDDEKNIAILNSAWVLYDGTPSGAVSVAGSLLADITLWDIDLSEFSGLAEAVGKYLYDIDRRGCQAVMQSILQKEVRI